MILRDISNFLVCRLEWEAWERLQGICDVTQDSILRLMSSFTEKTTMRIRSGVPAAVFAIALQVAPMSAHAQPAAVRPKVVLVELFTSEGCSSCPPADALLRKVNGMQTSAGQLIVGISEHVTYWNSLGWADPFSAPAYTERQNDYGSSLNLDGVYTPQMVVNGRRQFVGSDEVSLRKALLQESEPQPVDLRILTTSVAGNVLSVQYSAALDATLHGGEVIAVVADDADQSSVLRGENSGRTLAHVAVARTIAHVGKLAATTDQTVQVKLPEGFDAKAKHHVILFAQAPHTGRVLGADTKPL
jgi:hypothetical protein